MFNRFQVARRWRGARSLTSDSNRALIVASGDKLRLVTGSGLFQTPSPSGSHLWALLSACAYVCWQTQRLYLPHTVPNTGKTPRGEANIAESCVPSHIRTLPRASFALIGRAAFIQHIITSLTRRLLVNWSGLSTRLQPYLQESEQGD